MNEAIKQKFEKIKEIMFSTIPPATPSVEEKQFSDFQLKDGTPIQVDKLEAGGLVMVNGQPAPVGSHELIDGTIITVIEGGVIESVQAPAAAPEEAAAAPAAPQFATVEDFAAHQQAFAEYQAQVEQRFTQANEIITKQGEVVNQLMSLVEEIVKNAPAASPAEAPRSFSTQTPSKEEFFEGIVNTLETLKKQK